MTGEGDARHRAARAARPRRHLLPVVRIAADRRVDPAPGVDDAPDERHVFLLDLAIVELPRQLLVGPIVLGDDHQSRGPAIEPMHDPRPRSPPMPLRSLTWCSSAFTTCRSGGRPRVHDHARRLVEHDDVGILEDDAKRAALRARATAARTSGTSTMKRSPALDRRARPDRAAGGGGHAAVLDEPLNLRTRLAGRTEVRK